MTSRPTICEMFRRQAETKPDRSAICQRGRKVTYGLLSEYADSLAAWLVRAGLHRGDRVILLLPNSIEYVICYLGVLQAGGVVVALNPETTPQELRYLLGDSSPTGIVAEGKTMAWVADALSSTGTSCSDRLRFAICPETTPPDSLPASCQVGHLAAIIRSRQPCTAPALQGNDLAQIIYTSGTTGKPKGVMLTHRNVASNCNSILDYLELTDDDSVMVTLPFFYSYGNSLLFTHLAVGGELILASNSVFWNRILDLMQDHRITGFAGVPSSFAMLLHKSDFRKRTFPHLRYMTCAGGGLAPSVVNRIRDLLPHVQLFLMYGQTEATARLSTLMPDEIDAKLGSIGRGIAGVTLQVLDENAEAVPPGEVGEIVAQGENVMAGYWNAPEETKRVLRPEGLRTGDLARIDEAGYIYIVGRKNDMIKYGSYRINPKEIEEVILQLDGVAEVGVIGLPDDIWGEVPTAFVVASETAAIPTESTILSHCRRRLPRYKQIRNVRCVDSLPKTPSGKIKRAELRESDRAFATR